MIIALLGGPGWKASPVFSLETHLPVVVMVVYLMSSFLRFLDKGFAEKWGSLRKHGLENRIQH
jgi:hypothetical protein